MRRCCARDDNRLGALPLKQFGGGHAHRKIETLAASNHAAHDRSGRVTSGRQYDALRLALVIAKVEDRSHRRKGTPSPHT